LGAVINLLNGQSLALQRDQSKLKKPIVAAKVEVVSKENIGFITLLIAEKVLVYTKKFAFGIHNVTEKDDLVLPGSSDSKANSLDKIILYIQGQAVDREDCLTYIKKVAARFTINGPVLKLINTRFPTLQAKKFTKEDFNEPWQEPLPAYLEHLKTRVMFVTGPTGIGKTELMLVTLFLYVSHMLYGCKCTRHFMGAFAPVISWVQMHPSFLYSLRSLFLYAALYYVRCGSRSSTL